MPCAGPKLNSKYPPEIRKLASKLVAACKGRAKERKVTDFDLDQRWAIKKLLAGACEVTGKKFLVGSKDKWSPCAPSIDRIENELGYTKKNCRMVILQFNIAKGQWHDKEVVDMCLCIVEQLKRNKVKFR